MSFWELATQRAVAQRALRIALIVGTLLILINHGPALLDGDISAMRILQMMLTYLVPYGVSTYSSVMVFRDTPNE